MIDEAETELRKQIDMILHATIPAGREWMFVMPVAGDDKKLWQTGVAKSNGRALLMLLSAAHGLTERMNAGDTLYHPEDV